MDIVSGVRIAGIASAVPRPASSVEDLAAGQLFSRAEIDKISKSLGVRSRHIAPETICTSDLCVAAAERLLSDLNWSRIEVDALLFVSQTPDYILPATSCVIHRRLGLGTACAAFDINLGCSGYTYALYIAGKMLGGSVRKALILVGDTISKLVSPGDRATAMVFGDAGSATPLMADESARDMYFEAGTDGEGNEAIIVPAGGFRNRPGATTSLPVEHADGNVRSDGQLAMNGQEVFSFAIDRVPEAVNAVYAASGWTVNDVDGFVFHQANRFMLNYLAEKMQIPAGKLPIAMEEFGNTSSASIPLTLTVRLATQLSVTPQRLILAGFGVGFSWADAPDTQIAA